MNKRISLPAFIVLLTLPVTAATAVTGHQSLPFQSTTTTSFTGDNSQQAIRLLTANAVASGNYRPSSVFNINGMKAASGIVK